MRLIILLTFLAAPLSAQKPDTLRVLLTAWQREQFVAFDSTLAQLQRAAQAEAELLADHWIARCAHLYVFRRRDQTGDGLRHLHGPVSADGSRRLM